MTRDILHDELERIFVDGGLTGVFVTHDRSARPCDSATA
jgi:ABC-type nitrate/sulfonate/bicarbonate transport system ATPase subunit